MGATMGGPIPGGFQVGETVFFAGGGGILSNGDYLVYGDKGTVSGAGTGEWTGRVEVRFPGFKSNVNCHVENLSKTPPGPLPGGFQVGETVFFAGAGKTVSSGDALVYGGKGTVTGAGTGEDTGRVAVQFAGITSNGNCLVEWLSKTPPGPLPGGFKVDETVYFTGAGETFDDGATVVYGSSGTVTGPSIKKKGHVAVKFPHNSQDVACAVETLSRVPPGPLQGGFEVGETVFYTPAGQTLSNGDSVVHGSSGIVSGPGTGEDSGRIVVQFENMGNVTCTVEELSRTPPEPLPGGVEADVRK